MKKWYDGKKVERVHVVSEIGKTKTLRVNGRFETFVDWGKIRFVFDDLSMTQIIDINRLMVSKGVVDQIMNPGHRSSPKFRVNETNVVIGNGVNEITIDIGYADPKPGNVEKT